MEKEVREIQRNTSLLPEERSRLIRELFQRKVTILQEHTPCTHYKRNCKIIPECCKQEFSCRLCHDENSDHKMNRFKTQNIVCVECSEVQPVSNQCVKCNVIFGKYFCQICKLWELEPKDIFHCDKCGICNKGKSTEWIHCNNCKLCVTKEHHQCFQFLNDTCPVCLQELYQSTKEITNLKCNHILHSDCLKNLCASDYRCPLCKKSLGLLNTSYIDRLIEEQPMPEEYKKEVNIHCNDCLQKSTVLLHFIANKCPNCSSYNTCLV